jgi:hypothetical protein
VVEGREPVVSGSGWLKPLIFVASVMVVLAVISTAAVLLLGGPKEMTYPAGSPEAAFQDFVRAARSGDWTTADGLISADLKARGMDARAVAGYTYMTDVTVSIKSSTRAADHATLNVDYQFGSNSAFGGYSYDNVSSVVMILEADGWKLDSQLGGGF